MSALPATRPDGITPAEVDKLEADALEAIDGVREPEAAEELLGRVKLAAQAVRLSELGRDYEQRWGRVRLLAERRYGELLGPAENHGPATVTASDGSTSTERMDRTRARQVAAVPEPEFNGYVETAEQPTRAGLLRTAGQLSNQAGGTDEWSTPQDFFDVLACEFDFELDVCALPSSAKCDRFFSPENDGLAQEWSGVCWMNPPYGDEIPKWIAKASLAAEAGATVVALVPARVDTGWWWDYCRHAEVRFLRGRLKFGGAETSAPFPSAVVVFGRSATVVWWEWR